jgi:hypothetical protein
MLSPRTVLLSLSVIVATGILTYAAGNRFPLVLCAAVPAWLLLEGLTDGTVHFGVRDAKKAFSRKTSPFAYWLVVTFYCGFLVILAVAALRGRGP